MTKNEHQKLMEFCNKKLNKATPKPLSKTNYFTNQKIEKTVITEEMTKEWEYIMVGAEELDQDYIKDIGSEKLLADQEDWLAGYEDVAEPQPQGRPGAQELFNEENKHWFKLAENLKEKEPASEKGSKYINTFEASQITGLEMAHFLKCVWNLKEFVKPEMTENGMAYDVQKVQKIAKILKEGKAPPKEGFGKLVRGDKQMTKGDITYENEPTTFYSIGPDGSPAPTEPVRVSKFSDSEDIQDVAEMKRKAEVMERRVHKADVEGDTKKRDNLAKELKSLKEKIEDMSGEIQSHPDTDVT